MTDNEQRAHDLAIAITPVIYKLHQDSSISKNETVITFDVYNEYLNIYNKSLEVFNRDFPNGK